MNVAVRGGMIPILIYKKYRVKDLHRAVRIHGGGDVCDVPQIAIDKFTQADVILDRAASTAAADVKFKLGDAEGVLRVDQQEVGTSRGN